MNEIFDKLLIRIVFAIFICLLLIAYRYLHKILYPASRKQMFKKIYPTKNSADTIHLFSRIIGITLIFSTLGFEEQSGVLLSMFHFFIWGTLSAILYLVSIYVCESIALYNFTYSDEILKHKNLSYAIISFGISICLAIITRKVILESEFSIILLLMFWLYAMVLFGLCIKLYKFSSKFVFNKHLIQKNLALAFSFCGYLFAITTIIHTAFNQEHLDIKRYAAQLTLIILLSLIVFPLFQFGIKFVFKLQDDIDPAGRDLKMINTMENPSLGLGIYEGAMFYASGLLTSIIVGQVHFGIIYPFF